MDTDAHTREKSTRLPDGPQPNPITAQPKGLKNSMDPFSFGSDIGGSAYDAMVDALIDQRARALARKKNNRELDRGREKLYWRLNPEKKKEKNRRWRNSEKGRSAIQRWREDNKEHLAELNRTWRMENRERIKEYKRKYAQENKEKIAEMSRRWQQSANGKAWDEAYRDRRNALRRARRKAKRELETQVRKGA